MSFVFNALNIVVTAAESVANTAIEFVRGLFTSVRDTATVVTDVVPASSIAINLGLLALVIVGFKFTSFGMLLAVLFGLYVAVQVAIGLLCYSVVRGLGNAFSEADLHAELL
jgi:hypothetical protein